MPWNERESAECQLLLVWGMEEDLDEAGDITSTAVIPAGRKSQANVVARQEGAVAGLEALAILRELTKQGIEYSLSRGDGPVSRGETIATISAPTRTLLAIERTLLNLLCHLSGVATLTAKYVAAIHGTSAVICDTRKTMPGWRHLEKYAVRVGGGTNHRVGLFDAVLIKDNHLAALAGKTSQPIATAIEQARAATPAGTIVQVEVDTLEQLDRALAAGPDMILLDNMPTSMLIEGVERRNRSAPGILLEASGGINLDTIRPVAETGVDRISVGALTHSAPILDLALDHEASEG